MSFVSENIKAKAMMSTKEQGLLREVTGQRRNRRFVYEPYLDILRRGTEPISQ